MGNLFKIQIRVYPLHLCHQRSIHLLCLPVTHKGFINRTLTGMKQRPQR